MIRASRPGVFPMMAGGAARPPIGVRVAEVAGRPAALVFWFAFGLAARVWAVWHSRFDTEPAEFWAAALKVIDWKDPPVVGHPITGSPAGHPGALFFYLIALAQFLFNSRDPLVGTLAVAGSNLLAVALMYQAVREAWHPRAAIVFLFLALVSPWTLAYGDTIWPSNLAPLISAAVFWALVRMIRQPFSRSAGLLGWILIAGMQIHMSTAQLSLISLGAVVLFRPKLNWRWLVGGALLGCALYLPYLVHELRHGFENTRLILKHAPGQTLSGRVFAGLLLHFVSFGTTDASYLIQQGFWYGFDHFAFWSSGGVARMTEIFKAIGAWPFFWSFQFLSWMVATVGLIVALGRWGLSRDRKAAFMSTPLAGFYVFSIFAIIFLYLISKKGGYAHYVNMLLFLAFLPSVGLLARGLEQRWLGGGVALYLGLVPIADLAVASAYYRDAAVMALSEQKAVVRFVLDRSEGRPFGLRFSYPEGRGVSYRLLAEQYFQQPWPIKEDATDLFTLSRRIAGPLPMDREGLVLDAIMVVHQPAR